MNIKNIKMKLTNNLCAGIIALAGLASTFSGCSATQPRLPNTIKPVAINQAKYEEISKKEITLAPDYKPNEQVQNKINSYNALITDIYADNLITPSELNKLKEGLEMVVEHGLSAPDNDTQMVCKEIANKLKKQIDSYKPTYKFYLAIGLNDGRDIGFGRTIRNHEENPQEIKNITLADLESIVGKNAYDQIMSQPVIEKYTMVPHMIEGKVIGYKARRKEELKAHAELWTPITIDAGEKLAEYVNNIRGINRSSYGGLKPKILCVAVQKTEYGMHVTEDDEKAALYELKTN